MISITTKKLSKKLFLPINVLVFNFSLFLIILPLNIIAEEIKEANIPLHEATTGTLFFKTNEKYSPAVTQNSDFQLNINGLLANVILTQTFQNLSENYVEAVYVFPLIDDASVSSMVMEIGERRIVGKIKEKEQAKTLYSSAKKQGKKVSLVSQQRPNIFTTKVANIAPGETIKISLTYLQSVELTEEKFSIRLPLTLTPRYIPPPKRSLDFKLFNTATDLVHKPMLTKINSHGWAMNNTRVPDASEITPFQTRTERASNIENKQQTVTVEAKINGGLPITHITSLYHEINKSPNNNSFIVTLVNDRVPLNRDFVLSWQLAQGNTPKAAFFHEKDSNTHHHGLLMVMPPKNTYEEALKKEVVYIIDTSGSMGGVAIRQAKVALKTALSLLEENDTFNIIAFNNSTEHLFKISENANQSNIAQAISWISKLNAGGGTNMFPAIEQALQSPRVDASYRQVIFITDGSVGNESKLFKLIDENLNNTRLHTVGIGSAPNSYFMAEAAKVGRGTYRYIGNINEVNNEMSQLFSQINKPLMQNIKIIWPSKDIEVYPQLIPDLYAGKPLVVAARWSNSKNATVKPVIKISGMLSSMRWQETIDVSEHVKTNKIINAAKQPNLSSQSKGVSQWWASQKITELLLQKRRSTGVEQEELKRQITNLALKHHLLSPYTSFVAIEENISRTVETPFKTSGIKNLMPKGSSQIIPLANTSLGLLGYFYFAILSLLLASLLYFVTRFSMTLQGS